MKASKAAFQELRNSIDELTLRERSCLDCAPSHLEPVSVDGAEAPREAWEDYLDGFRAPEGAMNRPR